MSAIRAAVPFIAGFNFILFFVSFGFGFSVVFVSAGSPQDAKSKHSVKLPRAQRMPSKLTCDMGLNDADKISTDNFHNSYATNHSQVEQGSYSYIASQ